MKAIKETDLKRIFGEVMFNEFIAYMKGRTYVNSTTEPMYYTSNINRFLVVNKIVGWGYGLYQKELMKVEIEV